MKSQNAARSLGYSASPLTDYVLGAVYATGIGVFASLVAYMF